jgi:two-component sensor histidine kinase
MQTTQQTEHGWSLGDFTDTIHRGGVALWAWSPETRLAQLDSLCRKFWGMSESVVSIDALFERMHEDDREATIAAWFASAIDPTAYSFDFRIGTGDDVRWISARGVGGSEGRSGGWVQAIFLDITQHRRAEEAAQLVSNEMAHRLANMFAVARALTSIVAREASDVQEFANDLSGRFEVLHRATAMATGARGIASESIPLKTFLDQMLIPYDRMSGAEIVTVEDGLSIPADDINNYAMIVHELATNSAKYGAYSGNGSLSVTAKNRDGNLEIRWREELRHDVVAPDSGTGFGSKMLRQTVTRGLRGTIERQLDARSLDVLISIPAA